MTKEIELTRGKVALVDDEDYEELNQWKWYAHKSGSKRSKYYACRAAVRGEKEYTLRMHRDILGLKPGDGKICDHINRNPLDNRRANLRVANHTINGRNRGIQSNNTSGYKGVHWEKARKKWMADIKIHLGHFVNLEDAIEARKQGELKYWGEEVDRCAP